MVLRRFFPVLIILISLSLSGRAQQDELPVFTADSATFIQQVWDYFENYQGRDKPEKKDIRTFTNDIKETWDLPTFTQQYKELTVAVMNTMDSAGMRPVPHFTDFLYTALACFHTRQGLDNYQQWLLTLEPYMNQRQMRNYIDILAKWKNLFENNALNTNRVTDWHAEGAYQLIANPEPRLIFEDVTLKGYSNRDSTVIYNSEGVFYFNNALWEGTRGTITWERAGFHRDSVYAKLPPFSLDMNTVNFEIDSVNFVHKALFGSANLPGKLEEKVMSDVTPDDAIYPKFYSYNVRIPIPGIFRNMDYEGGFTMEGAKIIGSGNEYKDATLTIYRNKEPFMHVGSQRFSIKPDRLFAKSAHVEFFFEEDSVYHPNVSLSYMDNERTLMLSRGRDGTSQSPFFDSFHEMDMYYDVLSWNIDKDKMELQAAKSLNNEGSAGFESWDFFSDRRFLGLQVLDELHPIVVIDDYTKKIGSNTFYLYEIAEFWRKPREQAKAVLINLANYGFLDYDLENDRITVKDRLFNFLASKNKKRDYDVISVTSNVKNINHGELDLNSFDQKIRGVRHVFLSDSQNVMIYPAKTELVLKKDRDFTFSGLVQAGLLDFHADSCSFEYDTFRLNMPQIDSLTFMIRTDENDRYGNPVLKKVQTAIQDLNGYLLIDKPYNKSGLKDYPQYPIFTNLDRAYVYYDDRKIHDGIYNREDFFYTVEPFTFDSLNTFIPSELEFTGKLNSAGIFPDIEQPLKVQEDYSLGFQTPVPDTGYPVYGGKGRFYNLLSLSNSGMHGDGKLEYLTSELNSTDFLFFPDSMVTTIDTMQIAQLIDRVEYPSVRVSKSDILWKPYKDEMYIRNQKDHPFDLYNGLMGFEGMLTYSPEYLMGDGRGEFTNAIMESNRFKFYSHRFTTDTTTLELTTLDETGLALSTYVYSSSIDFNTQKGQFRTHGKGSVVNFPVNQFACFMDEFDWDMVDNTVDLRNNIAMRMDGIDTLSYAQLMDIDFSGSEFVSLHPKQDSLSFFCLEATYDLAENVISARDVKLIRIGDGALFPGNGLVNIFREAELSPLTNAVIITDSKNKYHTIYDADVKIQGKNSISGTGSYDYIDIYDDPHKLNFTELGVNKQGSVTAKTTIPENIPFPVSPVIDFAGDVMLTGNKKYLTFDGGFRIRQDCFMDETWVKVNRPINPDNVSLPSHDSLKDTRNNRVYTGLAFETVNNNIYPVFYSKKRKSTDFFILRSTGEMTYDNIAEEYRIRDTVLYKNFPDNGNHLNLNVRRCILDGQGQIDFGVSFPRVTVTAFGKVSHYIIPDSTGFEVLAGFDFFFNDNALSELSRELSSAELPAVSMNNKVFLNSIAQIVDSRTFERVSNDISLYGNMRRIPDELDFAILFSDLKLTWNPYIKAFVSSGPIGIAKIGKRQINKYVEGYVEISRRRTGDVFNIFLKIGNSSWYYFNYSAGVMQAISSNMEFNNELINVKDRYRKLKRDKKNGLEAYQYIISTPNKMSAFVDKMSTLSDY